MEQPQRPTPETESPGVHLIVPDGWRNATLVSRPSDGRAMHRARMSAGEGVFVARLPEGDTRFRFESDEGAILDLGGTMGRYPSDPPEDFTTRRGDLWVDPHGLLHPSDPRRPSPGELTVLTVNLHLYQERAATAKLHRVADAISALDADIVLLQEAGQQKGDPVLRRQHDVDIRAGNAALVITDRLRSRHQRDYDFFWDWSHLGWEVWEEGCAILTPHPILATESRFVTRSTAGRAFKWSRNVPRARIATPHHGTVDAYSVHLGWWDDPQEPFQHQFDQLLAWTRANAAADSAADAADSAADRAANVTADAQLLGGDFNIPAGSVGYDYLIERSGFTDVYLSTNPDGSRDPTVGGRIDGWAHGDAEGKRIDYLFLAPGSRLAPVLSQRTFTEGSLGRVSDHNGTYATFLDGDPLP